MLFIGYKCSLKSLRGKIEGDDGLFSFYGNTPDCNLFERLGFQIKLEEHDKLTHASFCGIISDLRDLVNIREPITALLDFGWTGRRYINAKNHKLRKLLRAKALSMLYQYSGCPILDSLARYAIRNTEGLKFQIPANWDSYQKQRFAVLYKKYKERLPNRKTGFRTRMLMESKFNIPIFDQLAIESYLDGLEGIQPLCHPAIARHCPAAAVHYYSTYVAPLSWGLGNCLTGMFDGKHKNFLRCHDEKIRIKR